VTVVEQRAKAAAAPRRRHRAEIRAVLKREGIHLRTDAECMS